jgi:hypothetical protein
MYSGSMVGAGAMIFAVWGYVIANMRSERNHDKDSPQIVELNPKLLGPILGEKPQDVEKAIEFLCNPDPESRTQEKQGRRLEYQGAFLYLVVNGAFYRQIKNEEERKEQLRQASATYRDKKAMKKLRRRTPQPGEGLLRHDADTAAIAEGVNRERGFGGEI